MVLLTLTDLGSTDSKTVPASVLSLSRGSYCGLQPKTSHISYSDLMNIHEFQTN